MIEVQYVHVCDGCRAKFYSNYLVIHEGDGVPRPVLPSGWSSVNDRIYCAEHQVNIVTRTSTTDVYTLVGA